MRNWSDYEMLSAHGRPTVVHMSSHGSLSRFLLDHGHHGLGDDRLQQAYCHRCDFCVFAVLYGLSVVAVSLDALKIHLKLRYQNGDFCFCVFAMRYGLSGVALKIYLKKIHLKIRYHKGHSRIFHDFSSGVRLSAEDYLNDHLQVMAVEPDG